MAARDAMVRRACRENMVQKILEIWLLLRENARPTMCHVKKKIRDSLSGLLAVELQNFRMISSHFLYCVRTPVDVKKSSAASAL